MNESSTPISGPAFDAILANEERFKSRLAIGSDAYQVLRIGKAFGKWWDVVRAAGTGGSIAASPVVAATFFAPQGILGLLGLGTAVTPVGWVVTAAVVAGGVWYGVQKKVSESTGSFVEVIPKYLNTPLDVISLAMFDFLAALSLKIAAVDGNIHPDEIECIRDHLLEDWGYDPRFVEAGLQQHKDGNDTDITAVANALASYKKENPDCNYGVMHEYLIKFLEDLVAADGVIRPEERAAIELVGSIFTEAGMSRLEKVAQQSGKSIKEAFEWSISTTKRAGTEFTSTSRTVLGVGGELARGFGTQTARNVEHVVADAKKRSHGLWEYLQAKAR